MVGGSISASSIAPAYYNSTFGIPGTASVSPTITWQDTSSGATYSSASSILSNTA